jgi:hypothetical protein
MCVDFDVWKTLEMNSYVSFKTHLGDDIGRLQNNAYLCGIIARIGGLSPRANNTDRATAACRRS